MIVPNTHIDYITKLESLANDMPDFEHLVAAMHDSFVEYDVEGGFSVGHGLVHDEDCAIQKNFTSAGAIFPTHVHDEYEYHIVLQGEGEVIIDGNRAPFKLHDCIVIKPGQSHSWVYTKHTKLLAITIPASKGYPRGKE